MPSAEVSTEVRGRLLVGTSAPRLESQITWRVHRGRLLGLAVDLPPAWLPDRVRIAGVDEPLDWHPEVQAAGGVRVYVVPPAGAQEHGPLILTVDATATISGGRGPLDLPRVRPVGVRVADELWVAWTAANLSLRPTSARGLAWIDPRIATGATGTSTDSGPDEMRGTLAWRWIALQAEASVDRERVETEPAGTVDLRAIVDRARIRYDAEIVIQAGEDAFASIALGTNAPWTDPAEWHFDDEATGLEVRQQPIDAPRRAALGLPSAGRAWELHLHHPRRGRVAFRARLEQPWTGRGALPLFVLPDRFHTRGTVVIEVERSVRSTVESTGLRALDPSVAAAAPAADGDALFAPRAPRRAHAFGYTSAGGLLELRTENLEPTRTAAVIREAVLTTTVNPQGPNRQHLILRIAADRTQRLELTLPEGAKLTGVERDGLAVVPTRESKGLSLPLVTQRASRWLTTITLDYLTPRGAGAPAAVLHPQVPATSIACLAFCWEIVVPEPWAVADSSPESARELPW